LMHDVTMKIMFPSSKVGKSWQLQRNFAEKRTLRCAAAKI